MDENDAAVVAYVNALANEPPELAFPDHEAAGAGDIAPEETTLGHDRRDELAELVRLHYPMP